LALARRIMFIGIILPVNWKIHGDPPDESKKGRGKVK
jgi:hypothetical protein